MPSDPAVPPALRTWFVIHCLADLLFAIPMMLAPVFTLELFGWTEVDPLTTRLVAAALVGIGVESYLGRGSDHQHFVGMLRLKMLWSGAANLGIALSIAQGAPTMAWLFQGIFAGFFVLWTSYFLRLRRTG
ncbi:MAG: hypothetical protein IPK80_29985 [Nannocystis sp.]|nr:hypothetical protein [Nannocystis sp.]